MDEEGTRMRFNKWMVVAAAALFSTNGFCMINAAKGFYLGAAAGFIHYIEPAGSTVNAPTATPMLRPVVGYRFNDYVAVEGGYNDVVNKTNAGNSVVGDDKLRIYTFDLACKLIRPYANGFSLFGKLGLGYTRMTVFNQPLLANPPTVNYANNRAQGLMGAGISYNINKNFAVDLSGSYYFRSKQIVAMELGAVGLTYTVDHW